MLLHRLPAALILILAAPAARGQDAAPEDAASTPEKVVATARERATRLGELALDGLSRGASVREAIGQVRLAHEVAAAAIRVSGDDAQQAAAREQLIARLEQIAKLAQARFDEGNGLELDVAVAKFHLHHARAHLALLKDDTAAGRSEFDSAIEHADRVAAIAELMENEGVKNTRADDLFLPSRARAELAKQFQLDPKPYLEQLAATCQAMLDRTKAQFEAGVAPPVAMRYPEYLLQMTQADLAEARGQNAEQQLRAAAATAKALVESSMPDPTSTLAAKTVAIRLLRDAQGRAAASGKNTVGLVKAIDGAQKLTAAQHTVAQKLTEDGAIPPSIQAFVDCAASLADLDALVPKEAVRVATKPNDHQGSVRFKLWDKQWYRYGEYTFIHDNGTWVRVSTE